MPRPQDEVELVRKFTTGQTLNYEFKTHLEDEAKAAGWAFFMPSEQDVNYGFTMKVEDARKDGFAVILYERPVMTFIDGETADHPPRTKVEKVGLKVRLTLSPINEITDAKDLSPKKPGDSGGGLYSFSAPSAVAQTDIVTKMVSELNALAMFIGNLDSALDFSPKLPLDDVKPGATWQKTVGYQPRDIKGTDKQAVQRLDYTYTFDGLVDSDGKKVYQVTAALDLDTDASKFLNQVMGMTSDESGLKELKLQLKTKIVYLLDQVTKNTLKATAESKGGFSITTTDDPDTPAFQQRMTGRSTLVLKSIS